MTKRIAIIAITAAGLLLAEQGAATAAPAIPTARELATTACKAQKSRLGKTFRKRYGAHPMRGCLRKQVPIARQSLNVSAAECDDEIATGGLADFIDSWSDGDGTGAYENCVIDGVVPAVFDDSGDDPVDETN
jgi:hypothetical protein